MKKIFKMMKAGDIVLLVMLVVLSFLPVILFSFKTTSSNADHYTAVISADGETIYEMELIDDGQTQEYEYVHEDGHRNVIVREGTEVSMIDANCTDQLCVRQGEISEVGETIVCLPHRVIVEVTSENLDMENDVEIDVIS